MITYNFTVFNLGNVTLSNIMITDPLPGLVISGGPITLAPLMNDGTTFTATYTITATDQQAGNVTNQATVTGTGPGGDPVMDLSHPNNEFLDDPTVIVLCPPPGDDPSMSLLKTGELISINGNNFADEGDTITYMFSIENTGDVPLYNITLEDTDFGILIGNDPISALSPGIVIDGASIDVLLPGEIDDSNFTATYTLPSGIGPFPNANANGFISRIIINQATARGEVVNGDPDSVITDLSDDPTELANVDIDGDGEPDDPTKVILPDPPLTPPNFEIFNGITPDGDGLNDFFLTRGIHNWPVNNMQIFNRWGILVYETDGYGRGSDDNENVFVGFSEGRVTIKDSELLPAGTYYYILRFPGDGVDDNPGERSYTGYLYINR